MKQLQTFSQVKEGDHVTLATSADENGVVYTIARLHSFWMSLVNENETWAVSESALKHHTFWID